MLACIQPSASGQLEDVLKAVENIDTSSPHELHFDLGGDKLPEGGHLQGVQWFKKGAQDFLILSGSGESFSYFVTIDLEDAAGNTASLSRLLDAPFRHAGGLQVLDGRFAAVGIEDNQAKDKSKVWIVDLATAESLEHLAPLVAIDRRGEIERSTAGALAITQIRDHHLLIVGTWDSATLDFYESNGHPLDDADCEFTKGETWSAAHADRSDWSDPQFGSYQNINLITDRKGRCFLAAFCREGDDDLLDLYELKLDDDTPTSRRLLKTSLDPFQLRKNKLPIWCWYSHSPRWLTRGLCMQPPRQRHRVV